MGIHDLVVHDYGPARRMISFHGEVPEDGNINELHEVIDRCERQIRKELGCETIIHMDPIAVNDEKVNKLKSILVKKIKDYNPDITIHDFRVVDGPNRQNVILMPLFLLNVRINRQMWKETWRTCKGTARQLLRSYRY